MLKWKNKPEGDGLYLFRDPEGGDWDYGAVRQNMFISLRYSNALEEVPVITDEAIWWLGPLPVAPY